MWQKALDHHRKLQALHRSEHVKQPPSAAVSEQLSSSAPLPVATPPRSSLPSIGRKRQPARHRVNASHPGSSELSRDTCLCGTPLARTLGHRSKQYCSARCRQESISHPSELLPEADSG